MTLKVKSYRNIDDVFRTIDTGPSGPDSPASLHRMFSLNDSDGGSVLCRSQTAADGGFVAGISGGTSGPGGLPGHFRGGVAVVTEMLDDPSTIGHIMAHEQAIIWAFSTRVNLSRASPINDDTPEDDSGNNNLMFPTITSQRTHLSNEQGWVLHHNPLLVPVTNIEVP